MIELILPTAVVVIVDAVLTIVAFELLICNFLNYARFLP